MSVQERNKIIQYWNTESLCSRESSTSHADPDLAYLDNAIENSELKKLLESWHVGHTRCLDVGAGLGRFAELWGHLFSSVVLLEPASSIYEKLAKLWQSRDGIQCYNCDFESFNDDHLYDLIFASGVLYLYSDDMVEQFVRKVLSMLDDGGLFVVRDFISVPKACIKKSAYVEGGFCYYRTPDFWEHLANSFAVKYLGITRSKPALRLLRNRYTLRILGKLHLTHVCRSRLICSSVARCGNYRLRSLGIQTVFVGMSKRN